MSHTCTFWLDRMLEMERLAVDEKQALTDHLAECRECAQAFEEIRELRTMLNQFAENPVPNEFAERVTEALRQECVRAAPGLNRVLVGLIGLLAVETMAAIWAPLGFGSLLQAAAVTADNLFQVARLAILSTATDALNTVTAPLLALNRLPSLPTVIQWSAITVAALTVGFLAVLNDTRRSEF